MISDMSRVFLPTEEWFSTFETEYKEKLVGFGVSLYSADLYTGTVVPAVQVLLDGVHDPQDELEFPDLWSGSLTPSSRGIFHAAWRHLVRIADDSGVKLPRTRTPYEPEVPLHVRLGVKKLLGAAGRPSARQLRRSIWQHVSWVEGNLKIPDTKYYGEPSDPSGYWPLLGWVLNPKDPNPMAPLFKVGPLRRSSESDALREEFLRRQENGRTIERMLGPLWSLPLIPVRPGERIPMSEGIIRQWSQEPS